MDNAYLLKTWERFFCALLLTILAFAITTVGIMPECVEYGVYFIEIISYIRLMIWIAMA